MESEFPLLGVTERSSINGSSRLYWLQEFAEVGVDFGDVKIGGLQHVLLLASQQLVEDLLKPPLLRTREYVPTHIADARGGTNL